MSSLIIRIGGTDRGGLSGGRIESLFGRYSKNDQELRREVVFSMVITWSVQMTRGGNDEKIY